MRAKTSGSRKAFADSLKTIGTNNHERLRNRSSDIQAHQTSSGIAGTRRTEGTRFSRTSAPSAQTVQRKKSSVMTGVLVLTVILILGVAAYGLARFLPVFQVTEVEANRLTHISDQEIAQLAQISQSDKLLTLDTKAISERIMANPWVADVQIYRSFPSTVKIIVKEKEPCALVHFTTANTYWYVSSEGSWIIPFVVKEGSDITQQIAATNLPVIETEETNAHIQPDSSVTMSGTSAAIALINGLSSQMRSQVATINAPNKDSLVLHLTSGIEVAFGEPKDIELKEQVITALLNEHKDEVTYINVRVPKQPAWRGLSH